MRDLGSGKRYGTMQKIATEMVWTHIERRQNDYVGKRNMELSARRRTERPKRSWSDNMDEDLENIGAMREDALDREHWRRNDCCSDPTSTWEHLEEEDGRGVLA